MFSIRILEILQLVGMFLLWSKVDHVWWWIVFVVLALMFFGVRTYYTAVKRKDDENVIKFWYQVRSIIFILDIISVITIWVVYFYN